MLNSIFDGRCTTVSSSTEITEVFYESVIALLSTYESNECLEIHPKFARKTHFFVSRDNRVITAGIEQILLIVNR
jgi:hypothetical protein